MKSRNTTRRTRDRLQPDSATELLNRLPASRSAESAERRLLYALLSSINSAILALDRDQNRSTVRSEKDSASAVSAVVKPAK